MVEWIKLTEYCKMTNERPNLVHVRVTTGVWQRGKHLATPDGGVAYVNIPAILEWCTTAAATPSKEQTAH